MKLFEVRAELNDLGLVLSKKGNDFRVAYADLDAELAENTALYSGTLDGALNNGRVMAANRDRATCEVVLLDGLAKRLRAIAATVKGDYVNFWSDRAQMLESWARTIRQGHGVDCAYVASAMREFAATAGVNLRRYAEARANGANDGEAHHQACMAA